VGGKGEGRRPGSAETKRGIFVEGSRRGPTYWPPGYGRNWGVLSQDAKGWTGT